MIETDRQVQDVRTSGDTAIDGLFAGLLAGLLMAAYLVSAGLFMSESPGTVLGRFDPGAGGSPIIGAFFHLAVAGIYGVVFGLVCHVLLRRWRSWFYGWIMVAAGSCYGIALYFLSQAIFLRELEASLSQIPVLHFVIAHLIYGFVLGLLFRRGLD